MSDKPIVYATLHPPDKGSMASNAVLHCNADDCEVMICNGNWVCDRCTIIDKGDSPYPLEGLKQ